MLPIPPKLDCRRRPGDRRQGRGVRWFAAVMCVWLTAGSNRVEAAFGVTTDSTYYTVDSGAGLVFKVHRTDGSLRSIKYNNGAELQNQSSWSHIASGYGPVTSTASNLNGVIKITCQTSPSNSVVKSLTHYFLVRSNINNIYMATHGAHGAYSVKAPYTYAYWFERGRHRSGAGWGASQCGISKA